VPYTANERRNRLRRWAWVGAICGLLMAAIDLMFPAWLGQVSTVSRTSQDGVAESLVHLIGGVIGGAFLFLFIALVTNVFIGRRERRR